MSEHWVLGSLPAQTRLSAFLALLLQPHHLVLPQFVQDWVEALIVAPARHYHVLQNHRQGLILTHRLDNVAWADHQQPTTTTTQDQRICNRDCGIKNKGHKACGRRKQDRGE